MTAAQIEKYFSYHNANMRLLEIGFDQIREQIKSLYRQLDNRGNSIYLKSERNPQRVKLVEIEKSLSRILSGIQVSWAEESIKRLLYEANVFDTFQRDFLLNKGALDQRWYAALNITFCIAYDLVPSIDTTCQAVNIKSERWNLGSQLVQQFFTLKDLITDQLVPNFSIRNKVQHGEWVYAFKPPNSAEFSQDITDKLNHENIISTTARFNLINAFYQMLVDLARFKSGGFALNSIQTPFEYFYDAYMKKIAEQVALIKRPNRDRFITELAGKAERGEKYRQQGRV